MPKNKQKKLITGQKKKTATTPALSSQSAAVFRLIVNYNTGSDEIANKELDEIQRLIARVLYGRRYQLELRDLQDPLQ